MKVITCASFYGSGSSALTDLVSEYSSVKDLSNFEFSFLYDLDGVRDLEYHLVENHNRHNSGHALKRFIKLTKFNEGNFISKRYSNYLDKNEYRQISKDYISELIDFSYHGWWFYDLYDKGEKIYYLYQLFNHLFRRIPFDNVRILKNEITYCAHPNQEDFYRATRDYVSKLLSALNKEQLEYLEIDQIVPSSNIEPILNYFNDEVFVFIVDRDPRDIYLLEKYCWHDHVCPTDPDVFCKWFLYARQSGKVATKETSHIVNLKFEDLIYKYQETVLKVEKVTGLKQEDHIKIFTKMNPKRSVVNTKLWEKYPNDYGIKIIEEKLRDYLYDYSQINNYDVPGVIGENNLF